MAASKMGHPSLPSHPDEDLQNSAAVPGCTLLNTQAFANEEEATDPASSAVQPGFAYHALDPDIITNYLGDGKTLGYVRVTVELMATDAADLKLLEQHDP